MRILRAMTRPGPLLRRLEIRAEVHGAPFVSQTPTPLCNERGNFCNERAQFCNESATNRTSGEEHRAQSRLGLPPCISRPSKRKENFGCFGHFSQNATDCRYFDSGGVVDISRWSSVRSTTGTRARNALHSGRSARSCNSFQIPVARKGIEPSGTPAGVRGLCVFVFRWSSWRSTTG